MDKVNVLIVSRLNLGEDYLEKIATIDRRISVKDGTRQFIAELQKEGRDKPLLNILEKFVQPVPDQQALESLPNLDTLLAEAEVIFGILLLPTNLLSRAPKLKWVHVETAGITEYISTGIFNGNIVVTNSKGVLAIPVAEHVLTLMLMLARNAERLLDNKQNKRWEQFISHELCGRTVGIIGLGAIGSQIARSIKSLGMRVLATDKDYLARSQAARQESDVFGPDELYPTADLHQMLSESDFVVVAVPLTEETEGLIGEAELRKMKPTARLINISRGPVVDQSAMIMALKEGWIAGAGLDVFEVEPLPTDSELWELPNVIISAHAAGATDKRSEHDLGMFCDNLRRYLAGDQLINMVDIKRGF